VHVGFRNERDFSLGADAADDTYARNKEVPKGSTNPFSYHDSRIGETSNSRRTRRRFVL